MSLPHRGRSRPDVLHAVHTSMPSKPSSPIPIPGKRRPVAQPINSPLARAVSPEMIFDMSPITSEFSVNHASFSMAQNTKHHEPFLYSFPVFSTHQRPSVPEPLDQKSPQLRQRLSPLQKVSHEPNFVTSRRFISQPSRSAFDEYDLNLEDPPPKKPSTRKITGFAPIKDTWAPPSQHITPPTERLSPGPRRSSYSSSPWILPGKGEGPEEDVAYSETDPSVFEFQRHLLRRIEHQHPSFFSGFRSYV